MAELKRKNFLLSTGKQIKLFGNSMAIGKTLEIGEGYAPNIFSCLEDQPDEKSTSIVANPHKLTQDEMMELADYNMQLWMDLKNNVRKYGIDNPKIFSSDVNRKE
jgi:hypothetical protein